MQKFKTVGLLLAGLTLSANVLAAAVAKVEDPWTRATAKGKTTANVYFHITSAQYATLTGASTKIARTAELRSMLHENDTMKNITISTVSLTPNTRVDMTSEHGPHVTLVDLKEPLKAGQTIPVTLTFNTLEKKDVTMTIKVTVKPAAK